MNKYLRVFQDIEKEQSKELMQKHSLFIKAYIDREHDAVVLKLFKDNWVTGDQYGIFFSIWIDEKELIKNRVAYNIHAIKISLLKQYSLKARIFAESFRKSVRNKVKKWPNISFDYGPHTLIQGYISSDLGALKAKSLILIENFICIHTVIDGLLSKSEKNKMYKTPGQSVL